MLLKEKRTQRKLNQSDVANKAGISVMSYKRYEYGERLPNVLTAISIGKAVGIRSLKEFEKLWGGNPTTS